MLGVVFLFLWNTIVWLTIYSLIVQSQVSVTTLLKNINSNIYITYNISVKAYIKEFYCLHIATSAIANN